MLTAHISASVGWMGALAVFLAHALVSLNANTPELARAADLAMGIAAWCVILPLAIAALSTGVVQALLTPWGLSRHGWIVAKLGLTVLATGVLLLKLSSISALAEGIEQAQSLRLSLTVHAAGGLIVLLTALLLAVYKPLWVTRKMVGLGALAAVVLLGLMVVFGQHGPGAH